MADTRSVASGSRYVITEQGRLDLLTVSTCPCELRLVGLLFICPMCDTVYGQVKDMDLSYRPFNDKR